MLKQSHGKRAVDAFALTAAMTLLTLLGACSVSPSSGQNGGDTHALTNTQSTPTRPAVALRPNPTFASLPRYEGTLGKRQIVLRLGDKTEPGDEGGLHGEYQFADSGQVLLVAGDADGGVVELDESDDGTRISGQWVGKLAADGTFKGVWSNVDESQTESIELHRVGPGSGIASPSGR